MCKPCGESNSCTLLYSDEFLNQLNLLSTPSKKVSFFSEYRKIPGYIFEENKEDRKGNMLNFITTTYKEGDKYENINFVGTDIRQESSLENPWHDPGTVYFVSKLYNLLKNVVINKRFMLIELFLKKAGFTLQSFSEWLSVGFKKKELFTIFNSNILDSLIQLYN
jgi:hypothetical protein